MSEWKQGLVIERRSKNAYLVEFPNQGRRVIHARMLRKFQEPMETGIANNRLKKEFKANLVAV